MANTTERATAASLTEATLPPATFYGPLDPAGLISPVPGMPVTAAIAGVTCGQGQLVTLNGQWAYKLQVAAAQNNACGTIGAPIQVTVGGYSVLEKTVWDNRQAQYQALTLATSLPNSFATSFPQVLFLPVINR